MGSVAVDEDAGYAEEFAFFLAESLEKMKFEF
jgi:hypothetical protein